METNEQLTRLRAAGAGRFEPGSDAERAALDRFKAFFGQMSSDNVDALVAKTYADDVFFDDTLKTVRGLADLTEYLRGSADATEEVRVEIEEITRTTHDDYLVRWRMMIRFKKFAKGQDTWSIGMSHLRFADDGRVAYHQDYWNAADGMYQHIPVLGHAIRAIKQRV